MPSVLIELGYVSNKQDLKLMMSEAWRARASEAVAQAVNTFFSTRLAGSSAVSAGRSGGELAHVPAHGRVAVKPQEGDKRAPKPQFRP